MYTCIRFLYLYFMNHISYIYTPAILLWSMDVRLGSLLQTFVALTELTVTLHYATLFIHICIIFHVFSMSYCGVAHWWVLIAKITMM